MVQGAALGGERALGEPDALKQKESASRKGGGRGAGILVDDA